MMNYNEKTKLNTLSTLVKRNCGKVAIALCLPVVSLTALANEKHEHNEPVGQKVSQKAADYTDATILATELGKSVEEVEASLVFHKKFEKLFKEVMKKHPEKVARVWLEPNAGQKASIQFVGQAPNLRTDLNVDIMDGGQYSFQEQEGRAKYLSKLLTDNAYNNFLTYFDHNTGQIKLEMKTANRAKALSRDSLQALLSNHNRSLESDESKAFDNLSIDDIDFEVIEAEGEIYELEYARGGEWLRDDGFRECTSGWAVSGPNGNGIVTAAHCTGLNELEHSYSTADVDMTWRSQERGNGDAEYHTTSHTEVAEYFARATEADIRDVTGIKLTFLMLPGQSVCEYGRSSNTRTCNHTVISNNVTATFTDGVTVSNLVRVTGDNSIGGDSGGPWSWGTIAWGVHSGSNGTTSLFTPVQRVQSELNVTILTQ
jgi:hypothetical protein